jgi:hypothetical protein
VNLLQQPLSHVISVYQKICNVGAIISPFSLPRSIWSSFLLDLGLQNARHWASWRVLVRSERFPPPSSAVFRCPDAPDPQILRPYYFATSSPYKADNISSSARHEEDAHDHIGSNSPTPSGIETPHPDLSDKRLPGIIPFMKTPIWIRMLQDPRAGSSATRGCLIALHGRLDL